MEIKTVKVGALETNCYLLISRRELAVLDPGGDAEKILRAIKKSGAAAKYIINTHNHSDHIAANRELAGKTGAEILADPEKKSEIKIGEAVLKVLHTPGHAEESICLLGGDFIFTGDTLFKDGHGRTDLPGGSAEKMEKSLQRLAKLLRPGMTVYPGHGPIFRIYAKHER